MKNLLTIITVLWLPSLGMAQTTTENFVRNRVYQVETTDGNNKAGTTTSLTNDDKIESVTYYDGLGRPEQIIKARAGGNREDLIIPIVYDKLGRQTREYLPYARPFVNYLNASLLIENSLLPDSDGDVYNHNVFYSNEFPNDFSGVYPYDINGFSAKSLEASPLNRVREQAAPGKDWAINNNHTVRFAYLTNTSTEVRNFKVNLTDATNNTVVTREPSLALSSLNNGFYMADDLHKTVIKDENWTSTSGKNNTTEQFTDKKGRVILKRAFANMGSQTQVAHDTYYVYDDYGNLTYVIPPLSDGTTSTVVGNTTKLNELCYQYKYDNRNRLVEKKVPGKGWEYIVYNKLDQPILSQDQVLKASGKWLLTKYDVFGRVAYTGYISSSNTRSQYQALLDGSNYQYESRGSALSFGGTSVYYSKNAQPTSATEIYTINYYDNYSVNVGFTIPSTTAFGTPIATGAATKGLPTVTKVKVLATSSWITTAIGYDNKGRVIWTKTTNPYLGVTETVENKLDFVGNLLESKATHQKTGKSDIVLRDYYTYDHVNRLKKHTQSINGGSQEVIAENTYDKFGQLVSKGVGNSDGNSRLQNISYSYNVRGWLKTINDVNNTNKLFNFKIAYNDPSSGTPLYNGNISRVDWRTSNTDNGLKNYRYYYDHLNRVTSATANSTNYNVSGITYDKNGNIITLTRRGAINSGATSFGEMDKLVYSYQAYSNKLLKVADGAAIDSYGFKDDALNTTSDSSNDYNYDLNGNLVFDANKGIGSSTIPGITYNHLNLPTSISLPGGTINYTYDAQGLKLQKKIIQSGQANKYTFYAGSFIYERSGDSGSGTLSFFNQPEGYIEPDETGGFEYVYQYKDHLGNIRVSYTNTGTASSPIRTITEENNYYPFGQKQIGYNNLVTSTTLAQKYRYNGKEIQDELELDWYNYGARSYDASLGRWFSIDGMSEKYLSNSPYHFANNNPILNFDVDGNYFVNDRSLLTALIFRMEVRQQINKNNNGINQLRGLINDGGLSSQAVANLNGLITGMQGANSELQNSLDEVSTLMSSSQGYNIEDAGAFASSGHTTYDFNTGVVNIKAPLGKDFGLLGHELKHAYQFDQGLTSLASSSGVPKGIDLVGVDLLDEWDAYRRMDQIQPGSSPYKSYTELSIDRNSPYVNHSRTPHSVSEHAEIQKRLNANANEATKSRWLNNYSRAIKQAFRINGKTYNGKN